MKQLKKLITISLIFFWLINCESIPEETIPEPETSKELIADKVDINTKKEDGINTVSAGSKSKLAEIKELISSGIDVNMKKGFEGRTFLHDASSDGDLETVKFLISKKADVNVTDNFYSTPLFLASAVGHLEVVKFLIANKADIHAKAIHNITPLHISSYGGHIEVVQYLLSKGANKKARASDGKTPLDMAEHEKHLNVVSILKEGESIDEDSPNSAAFNDIVTLKNGNIIKNVKATVTSDSLVVTDAKGKTTVYKKSQVLKVKKN